MFTGLVQALGIVLAATDTPAGKRLTVSLAELVDAKINPGDSICVSGVCLTAVKITNGNVHFDVITETLHRTILGSKVSQDRVNLELSLRGDSFVGGHFVQGHVDAIATVTAVDADPRNWRITFLAPASALTCIVPKGSIAVDGVSMTIAEVKGDKFTLAVIPTTLENTTLSALRSGDKVNLETDILARTVVHYLEQLHSPRAHSEGGRPGSMPDADIRESSGAADPITLAKLRELGFA